MMPEPVKKHLRHKVVISTSKRQTALGKKIKVIIYEKTIFFPLLIYSLKTFHLCGGACKNLHISTCWLKSHVTKLGRHLSSALLQV